MNTREIHWQSIRTAFSTLLGYIPSDYARFTPNFNAVIDILDADRTLYTGVPIYTGVSRTKDGWLLGSDEAKIHENLTAVLLVGLRFNEIQLQVKENGKWIIRSRVSIS